MSHPRSVGKPRARRRQAGFPIVSTREEHIVQDPNVLLAILGKMAQKPETTFGNLYPKLYNTELWLMAYESIAPNPGNMTAGVDGKTIDGTGMELIQDMVAQLKASSYKPTP